MMYRRQHLSMQGLLAIVNIRASPEEATPPRFVS
jgi:hypothetical protein